MKKYLNPEYKIEAVMSEDIVSASHILSEDITATNAAGDTVVVGSKDVYNTDKGKEVTYSYDIGFIVGM